MQMTEETVYANDPSEKATYVAPAIIYEGQITTRAGSPFFAPTEDASLSGIDPAADPAGVYK